MEYYGFYKEYVVCLNQDIKEPFIQSLKIKYSIKICDGINEKLIKFSLASVSSEELFKIFQNYNCHIFKCLHSVPATYCLKWQP